MVTTPVHRLPKQEARPPKQHSSISKNNLVTASSIAREPHTTSILPILLGVFCRGQERIIDAVGSKHSVKQKKEQRTYNYAKYNSKRYALRVCTCSYDILVEKENMLSMWSIEWLRYMRYYLTYKMTLRVKEFILLALNYFTGYILVIIVVNLSLILFISLYMCVLVLY